MNRIVSLILLVSFTFLPSAFAADANKAKIGIILPLTGEAASWGESVRNGMLMAYEQLSPERQGLIDIIFEDDQGKPSTTITAYQKLISQHELSAVITIASAGSNALAPITEKKQIPLLAIATDPQIVKDRKYVVNFWVTPEQETLVLMPEIQRRGYKHIARINTIHPGFQAYKTAFDAANKGIVTIGPDIDLPFEERDFRSFITRVRNERKIDAIFLNLVTGQAAVAGKQIREAGITLPLFCYEVFEDKHEVENSKGAFIGQWYVNAADPSKKFIADYTERYPKASIFGSGNSYDAILLLASAAEKDAGREAINRFLHELKDFHGVLGTYSATGDNRFTLPAAIKEITSDGFKTVNSR